MTEVETTGYLNDPHLVNPPHAYRAQSTPAPTFRDGVYCGYTFLRYVPALNIRYMLSADPTPCIDATRFPPQTYRTWLPPAKREVLTGVLLPDDGSDPGPQNKRHTTADEFPH
jgi:hypothetical protein